MPSGPETRPDPDDLLRRVRAQEDRDRRGKLKVFFGFAPGVGKTYRMLQVARDLVTTRHLDVVVGVVEDHGRRETAQLLAGLPSLPRRIVEHRGRQLEELDLDAALARRPEVLLVDELAHTNASGGRHAKRWQDVEELLDAGIDVFTTLNVQHVESLNDVVSQITRIRVRETVPDAVLDRADEVELVDIAPEELLARLRDGKVYLPEQARRAAEHFFRRGNLLALRELSLRQTAQHVDDDVREYREEHGVADTWPAGERILVCVGPSPGSDRLVRAAARMAAGLRCEWIAAHVDVATGATPSEADRDRLESHLRLAESLGATITRLSGPRVSDALLEHARRRNVTRLVVGKPTHSRLRDRLRGSLLDEIVRGSGDVDVIVVGGESGSRAAAPGELPRRPRARGSDYAGAATLVAGTLGVALLLREATSLPDLEMLFLLAVMVTASRFGRGPSLLAAALGVACYDFFFVPPFHTFSVDDRRYFLTFTMMFGVGFVMSELTGRLRRQEREALSREERTAALYALTRELASTRDAAAIAAVGARHAAAAFDAHAIVLGAGTDGELRELSATPEGTRLEPKDLGVARWALGHDSLAGLGTDTLPGATTLCAPLVAGESRLGVLALVPSRAAALGSDQRALLDVFRRQIGAALERARLSEEARQAALRARAEETRSSLLSAVSHDLRTPLASITGASTSLRDDANLDERTRAELLESIVDQAARLERLVANLLDMTRLDSGAVALRRDWVPLDEVIGSALTRLEAQLEGREVSVSLDPDLPLVSLDPVLYEQVFVNLLENACKYGPPGAPIRIAARRAVSGVEVEVSDRGPGLPDGTSERVFEKFYRGAHPGVPGAGLGLAICKGIVEAHGGSIRAASRPGGGTTFQFTIPSDGTPPSLAATAGGP